ncbi:ATP-binding protein [Bradyrhizobium sp. 157]|uniref:ATP-binding protein n=1 Tax=Bradyrhizobium sp. 157 TaxID=2782631 RepID=UPI003209A1AF
MDRKLVLQLAECAFNAHNVVLVGGPGMGKTHLATAVGVSGVRQHRKRVRFYSCTQWWTVRIRRRPQARLDYSDGQRLINSGLSF